MQVTYKSVAVIGGFERMSEYKMAEVKIIAERCKSCGYCIRFCPKEVLIIGEKVNSKGYEYVAVGQADRCVGCCICARICPDGAIEIFD